MHPFFGRAAVIVIVSLGAWLAGCAVTSGDGRRLRPGSDAFADYVEAVFRRQDRIRTEVGLALDEQDPESDAYFELEAAELELQMSCRGLNELASRRRDGEDAGGIGALRRARQAPECERAVDRAEALL
jgi:hypothetical protein